VGGGPYAGARLGGPGGGGSAWLDRAWLNGGGLNDGWFEGAWLGRGGLDSGGP